VVITILAMNDNKNSASFVFSDFVNLTGFPNSYTAILGLLQAAFGMCCYDSASRMTEEVKNARKQAPRAIVLAVYIGFVTGFVFLVAACYCMGDVDEMASTSTGVPIIEIFYYSTGSNAGATGLAALILVVGFGASNALTASGGRSIYAFARDHGLPFSGWLSKVHESNATPVNGLLAAVGTQMVLLAIYFGASQGFGTVIAIATEGFCMFLLRLPFPALES
jgi:choline transport protein